VWNRKRSKKDPKKVVKELRRAIAGEPLVEASVKGIDLSTLSLEQLQAIVKIQGIYKSDLSEEEKEKQAEDVYRMAWGITPITAFKVVDGNEIITERRNPTWFGGNQNSSSEGLPSWFDDRNNGE